MSITKEFLEEQESLREGALGGIVGSIFFPSTIKALLSGMGIQSGYGTTILASMIGSSFGDKIENLVSRIYKKMISKECGGNEQDKDMCIANKARKAITYLQKQKNLCMKTKDPNSCVRRLDNSIKQYGRTITKIERKYQG